MIRTRLAAVLLAAAVATGLSACSGGADAAPAAAPDATAPQLRLGYFANLTHAPAIVGVEDGAFQKALGSTALQTSVFNAGPAATEALLSGAVDATFIGPGPTTNAYVQSKAITVIAGTAANGAALVVKPGITTPAQLKGRRLSTPQLANTQDIALRYWLKQQGLATTPTGAGDVSIAPQSNGDTVNAFKQGQIDGAWVPEPYASQLVAAGGKVLVDEKTLWPGGRFVTTDLAVSTKYLEQYPGTVTDLLEGLIAAEGEVNGDPAAAQRTVNGAIGKITGTPLPEDLLKTAWSNVEFTVDPIAGSLKEGAEHAKDVGLLTGDVDLAGLYDLEPLNALLKQAGKPEVSAS
ncbi:ABC transporter substrate-binding protein [Amnibacterium endophyticum]|uniref:ABC transporter substrate-binding protein n=1 Tax=Amnibacterium endophyticum TaxID=2109337 RepID=A0ABW4LAM3_9MICO